MHSLDDLKRKLKRLSEKIKHIKKKKDIFFRHKDEKIQKENLLNNYALIIAKTLKSVRLIERLKVQFVKTIEEYNEKNNIKLSLSDFEDRAWVRTINNELMISPVVNRFIWRYVTANEGRDQIPSGEKPLVECLVFYLERYPTKTELLIDKDELHRLDIDEKNIKYLVDQHVILADEKGQYIYNANNDHARYLRNDIVAILWLLLRNGQEEDSAFRRFMKILLDCHVWFDSLAVSLPFAHLEELSRISMEILRNDKDLLCEKNEFAKAWYDDHYHEVKMFVGYPPDISLEDKSPHDLIRKIEKELYHYQKDILDNQESRRYYSELIEIVIQNDMVQASRNGTYENVRSLFKDTSRPYLVYTLYNAIPGRYPEIIPFLLLDPELAPLAFLMIDKIEVDGDQLRRGGLWDENTRESCFLINEYWDELFDVYCEISGVKTGGKEHIEDAFSRVLYDMCENVYDKSLSTPINSVKVPCHKERRDAVFSRIRSSYKIGVWKTSNDEKVDINALIAKICCAPKCLQGIPRRLVTRGYMLRLDLSYIDVLLLVLSIVNMKERTKTDNAKDNSDANIASKEIVLSLYGYLKEYYSLERTEPSSEKQPKLLTRSHGEIGYEIVDWGLFYANLEKHNMLEVFHSEFKGTLKFNSSEEKYHDQNKEQREKVICYLKSLMLAYLALKEKADLYENMGFTVQKIVVSLEERIKELSIKYSHDDLNKERMDVFNEPFNNMGNGPYYQKMTTLLYRCINHFDIKNASDILSNMLGNSLDLGRMLIAINILEKKELKDVVAKIIKGITVEDYINSVFWITDLEQALIESVNSDSHWQLAESLISKVKSHIEKKSTEKIAGTHLLFEVNLILLFKKKDYDGLVKLEEPSQGDPSTKQRLKRRKEFIIAVYEIFNNAEYTKAIHRLKKLREEEPINPYYAFYVYKAKTLGALKEKSRDGFVDANTYWEEFVAVNRQEKHIQEKLAKLSDDIEQNKTHYYAAIDDKYRMDQLINRLPAPYLYDKEIVETVFQHYYRREEYSIAFNYIKKVEEYYKNNGMELPDVVDKIREECPDEEAKKAIKSMLESLISQRATDIPDVVPNKLNGEKPLSEFILYEIVQAARIMLEKIKSIEVIKNENKYSDIIQAILRLRLPVWGWDIADQSRTGKSSTGKDAGEADLTILSGGNAIALAEALVLKGKNKKEIEGHVKKIFNYNANLKRYYMLIYYVGKDGRFDFVWDAYKKVVMEMKYEDENKIITAHGVSEKSSPHHDTSSFRLGETKHGKDKYVYHVMINIGENK